ncbi:transglycosylase SLT domain-containing protein [Nocardioides sp. LML1-1-1.1]|uniref:aggregation-promoting factor C-terminal-like domain-containing protein n=1 Tax=Nocardioides sp. LML1-1-1.1 TaxID=3135248 RepID=UPI00341EB652
MGGPRPVLCAAVALLATACGTTTTPAAEPARSGSPSARQTASPTASPTATPSDRATELSRSSGARADVPDAQIMAQLARRAERIAKNLPPVRVPADVDRGSNRALGYQLMIEFGFPEDQWPYLDALWHRESGWNHLAENASSGAYGIPQSLPGTKMAVVGSDWRTNPETQINWGLAYIGARYGTPQKAWAHSEQVGWY